MQEPTFIRTGSALSGLLLVLFLVVHLAGLLPALIAPVQFEQYATVLHQQPWLPLLEISLAATAAVHLSLSIAKTCLLYTSPSPRDATLSRMPSSA